MQLSSFACGNDERERIIDGLKERLSDDETRTAVQTDLH